MISMRRRCHALSAALDDEELALQEASPNDGPIELLLIDDDDKDIFLTKRAFKKSGVACHIQIAKNGEEGLALLRREEPYENAPRPVFILLDLNMPRMNGLEFIEIIKQDKRLRTIPVIVFTTSNEQSDRSRAYDYSVAGYMVKPVDYDQFLLMMRSTFSYWYFNELPPVITSESSIISSPR